ncbi:heme/hemin ABC transporter substrate-binding protein [Pararhodobacter oceanensis]|uniref:Hemin ABC transporter substrate-binding protein n=1 Tax=Pararhodobacter oceanensis TaxID=2172121 RepID=A0A2T8HZ68_9RHOB|nr:ABC transporter substrate-binding protein [Pararhodobacter oceanensis]PVH30728.1 hemin ABC transporter substrate-binding protein [Pararhodobacter oceanensis]
MRYAIVLAACLAAPLQVAAQERVVVAGSALSEITAALGQTHRLVGRDQTSTYPAEIEALPDLGYLRALSAEGLLSLNPDLILADADAGPPETMDLVASTEIPVVRITADFTAEGVIERIAEVGQALSVDPAPLQAEVQASFDALAEARAAHPPLRAMFILTAQGGQITAAGSDTAAEGILHLAGAQNALQGFSGYRQITDEAITNAAPDVLVMMERTGDHSLEDADLQSHAALSLTPAVRDGRVIRMEGSYLLGFGPRTPDAALQLLHAMWE